MSPHEFELLKLVGAAFLGSVLTFVVGRFNEWRRSVREDRQHLLHAGLLLLEWTQLPALYADKSPIEFQREQWRVLVGMSTAVASVGTRSFVPLCVSVSRFAPLDAERTNAGATSLFAALTRKANRKLAKAYEAQLRAPGVQPQLTGGVRG